MGGRAAASAGGGFLPPAELEQLAYNVASFDDPLGGATIPFLERTGRAWRILIYSAGSRQAYSAGSRQAYAAGEQGKHHPAHTFGLERPALRWVNGDQVSDLYVDGMTTERFLEATGLQLDLGKGGFVLSKRISRIMHPHFVSGFFDPADVRIAYMEQSPDEAKVWDGAGLVSRRMLRKLVLSEAEGMILTEDLSPAKRADGQNRLARARWAALDYLSCFPPEKRPSVLLGALASVYGQEKVVMDTAVWLGAADEEQLLPLQLHSGQAWLAGVSPAQATMAALREVGLLAEIIETKEGLVVYPAAPSANCPW